MPDNKKAKDALLRECERLKIPCGGCSNAESVEKSGFSGVHVFCGLNAGFKDISPWVSLIEARKCPGPELRALFLSAPAHYAKAPPDST